MAQEILNVVFVDSTRSQSSCKRSSEIVPDNSTRCGFTKWNSSPLACCLREIRKRSTAVREYWWQPIAISGEKLRKEGFARIFITALMFLPVSYPHLRAHETPQHLVC